MEDAPNQLISVFTNLFRQGPLKIWTENSMLSSSVQEISSSIYEPILRLSISTDFAWPRVLQKLFLGGVKDGHVSFFERSCKTRLK